MSISIRNLAIIFLAWATTMLFSQCCTCGDRVAPSAEEETVNIATDQEAEEEAPQEDVAEETISEPAKKTIAKDATADMAPEDVAPKKKPLSITISNLKSETAPVIFSVYDNPDTYLDPKAQIKTYRFVPKGKTLKIKLTDLPYGTYAIAFYQDMNDSGAIDKNFLGIPKEPYAFSNDIRPKTSAPSFADCKFVYSKTANAIKVKMGK